MHVIILSTDKSHLFKVCANRILHDTHTFTQHGNSKTTDSRPMTHHLETVEGLGSGGCVLDSAVSLQSPAMKETLGLHRQYSWTKPVDVL